MKSEPTLLVEVVRLFALLATTFGVALNAEDQAAIVLIIGGVISVGSLALAFLNRHKVYAPASVQKIADAATFLPAGTPVDIGKPPEGKPEG